MSEQSKKETTETTKLCPFRRVFDQILYEQLQRQKMDSAAGLSELFGDCLQERCAMWRTGLDYATARHIQKTPGQVDYDIDCVGFCGLAGKP